MSKYGIPYLGSKSSIADSIAQIFPKADNFYDLFGGGFSMTHCMLLNKSHKFKNFYYNEIKSDIVELVKKSINGDYNYDKFKPKWISREDFIELKDKDPYVKICWSFGNNQRDYIFGKEIEDYKKSLHQSVVFNEFDEIAKYIFGFEKWPAYVKTIKQKRSFLGQRIIFLIKNKSKKTNIDINCFQNLLQLEKLQGLEQLERLQGLEQLERLQKLQELKQLERLERLERLHFYSESYDKINILPNSVVYCDPPYDKTADYGNNFNTKKFLDWAASRDFPVYISEYKILDSRFKLIYKIDKRSMISQYKNDTKIKEENIYWNGVSN